VVAEAIGFAVVATLTVLRTVLPGTVVVPETAGAVTTAVYGTEVTKVIGA
jgi:hypothetical protein